MRFISLFAGVGGFDLGMVTVNVAEWLGRRLADVG